MLHQNKRGMQKTASRSRLRNRDEITGLIEELDEERGLGTGDTGLGDVCRAQIAAMLRAVDPGCGQRDGRQVRQHVAWRHHRPGGKTGIALQRLEVHGPFETEVADPRSPQRRQMRPDPEPLPQIVRQRPDVEAGGAVDSQRHRIRLGADDLEAVGRDAAWGW